MQWSGFGCLAVVLLSTRVSAAPIFIAPVEGDWFDGTSWSSGVAPTAADEPRIDNGATATASSASPLYPGGGAAVEVQSLGIGSRLDSTQPEDAAGALELTDVDLSVAGDLSVAVYGVPDEPGEVMGSLSAAGGNQTMGNVSVGGRTDVGVTGGPTGTSATGVLAVSGDLETTEILLVGSNGGGGSGSGEVVVGGELRVISAPGHNFGQVGVGVGGSSLAEISPELATGSLSIAGDLRFVHNARSTRTELKVGSATFTTRADGRTDIGGDVIGFKLVDVGVAQRLGDDSQAIAVGELHVTGKMDGVGSVGGLTESVLSVGVTRPGFSASGHSSAEGYATIGEIEARIVEVGISEDGPATGALEIGIGDLGQTIVGMATTDADASGTLETGGGLSSVIVGWSEGGGTNGFPFIVGNATGSVTAAGFARQALVGLVNSDGSANGYLEVEGIRRDSFSALGVVTVGNSNLGAGTAEGRMLVRSGGIDARRVSVGAMDLFSTSLPTGAATGALESTGDVTTTLFAGGDFVGYAGVGARGHADGTWILHDGTYSGRKLTVGLSEGTGTATGRLHLDRMLVDTDDLTLGDGATIEIDVLGLLRGVEYSAIDASLAKLDGDLAIVFGAPAQPGVYDLIVSGALDGISGDFESVSIAGLAADQQAFWGIETASTGVEVFRLHVVPEPATAALLALGLVALASARRGR